MEWEDYFYPNTETLINCFNETNKEKLEVLESIKYVENQSELMLEEPRTDFTAEHVRYIHYRLFNGIYEWAGEYRLVDTFKEQTAFTKYSEIDTRLKLFLEEMNKVRIPKNNFEICRYLATYYKGYNRIHPFREGNGRTGRELIRELVLVRFPDYKIDYTKMNRNNFILGVKEEATYPELLAFEFYNALEEKSKSK